jgi:hypothetical protein
MQRKTATSTSYNNQNNKRQQKNPRRQYNIQLQQKLQTKFVPLKYDYSGTAKPTDSLV